MLRSIHVLDKSSGSYFLPHQRQGLYSFYNWASKPTLSPSCLLFYPKPCGRPWSVTLCTHTSVYWGVFWILGCVFHTTSSAMWFRRKSVLTAPQVLTPCIFAAAWQYLVFAYLPIKMVYHITLICISLITSEVEYPFMSSLTICISSLALFHS